MNKVMSVLIVVFFISVSSFGSLVMFDFRNDSSIYSELSGVAMASVTNGEIVATLSASDGTFNRTGSGFGMNGVGSDDTDGLNASQYIDIAFNQAVIFSNLTISSWGGSDAGEVQRKVGASFVSQGNISGTGDTPYGFFVNTDETVRILATADSGISNGFSVDSFTVAIPEPSVLGLVAFGSGIVFLSRRRES